SNGSGDPFGFDMMRYTRSTAQSKELNFLREPAVIISASGMAEAGRILHHLKNNVEDPRNTVLIVGWQAPHTLGRRIVEKQSKVRIFGEEYMLRAQVATINGLSAHADRSELLEWAAHFKKRPQHTYIVHGEEDASHALADGLRNQGFKDVNVPQLGQGYIL
ncbi:MAG: MBL fold metallo-hydrolase, partial [Phycisphaerae bacterium]|nr:MBL fold metallo-hydrolase [Phycisphaerae bacterium]NIX26527.1 MBL fold metallo-hydrolase [Phycisphaerae bacterium]